MARDIAGDGHRKVIRVAVVDENDIFRRGLVACLETDELFLVVYDARDGPVPEAVDVVLASARAATGLAGPGPPKLICGEPGRLDGHAPQGPADTVLSRTGLTEEQVLAAVRAAACGLLVGPGRTQPAKRTTEAVGGGPLPERMSERMRDVLRLLADGCATREIAERIGYSERTVKSVVRQTQCRLGARNRAQAVAEGIRRGII
ncbi:response regulator transcription factor [Streptomyces atriruber]|uniref:response regulator transcription factor n=1 Tax=Streptomyces atriruber TaxID=545121 RepID=UPI0012FF0068|nr:LuxR C-terminal-related transcriptional regulator [Streptomyces atriruber]